MKQFFANPVNVRVMIVVLVVVLFVLGAGAPGCPGGLVG